MRAFKAQSNQCCVDDLVIAWSKELEAHLDRGVVHHLAWRENKARERPMPPCFRDGPRLAKDYHLLPHNESVEPLPVAPPIW